MENEHERAALAVRMALASGHGRGGTAQHLAWLLLLEDRTMQRSTVVEAVYMALRRGETKIAIRRLESVGTTDQLGIFRALEWWRP